MEVGDSKIVDKVVLVTGGAAGIGAGTVRSMLAEGARHVIFLDTNDREGATLESELTQKFGAMRAKFIKCDLANESELNAAYNLVLDKYRRLDIVVNNAAVLSNEEELQRTMINVNFAATVQSTTKAIEAMRADKNGSGGTVLNISSLLALRLETHLPVYTATKAAVLQFSSCIGDESHYSATRVRVLTVCLGPTDTAILHKHNLTNIDSLRTDGRQRVESAVTGILEVIKKGVSGSTWKIANDVPAKEITEHVKKGYEVLSKGIFE